LNWLRRLFARRLTRNLVQQERNAVAILEAWSNVPMGCCDCGLIHRFDFWVNSRGQLCVRAHRDHDLTAAIRTIRTFPLSRATPDVPSIDVHPANVRPTEDERDRRLRFRDRLRAGEPLTK